MFLQSLIQYFYQEKPLIVLFMKKYVLIPIAALFTIATLSSYENGNIALGLNCTGANGSTPTCGGGSCHNVSGTSNIAVSISLTDDQGNNVSNGKYIPGKTYKITLKGNNGAGGIYPVFGLQFTAANPPNDGTFVLVDNKLKSTVHDTYEYIEHNAPIATNGNISTAYFYWVAPPAGAGTITFYCTMLTANGDHSINGDKEGHAIASFAETQPNAVDEIANVIQATIFPNPARESLTLQFSTAKSDRHDIAIFDLSGRSLMNEIVIAKEYKHTFDVSSFPQGMYHIAISNGQTHRSFAWIKQ